jgi:hypothetical protein
VVGLMRVYLPATLAVAADLLASGSLPGPLAAYAVTDDLRAWVDAADQSAPSDDEELELVALSEAARGSLRLIAADLAAGARADLAAGTVHQARRVVLAADVPDASVRVDDRSDDAGPGQVTVTGAVSLAWVRAAHVDAAELEPEVRVAAAHVLVADAAEADESAAAAGSAAAEAVVAALGEHELLWFAPEELALVVAARA